MQHAKTIMNSFKIYPLPASDRTHHIDSSGKPIYPARFIEVGKFHPPGLAPVFDKIGWYHILPNGKSAYEQRYEKVWGFYFGYAAAKDLTGWTHIDSKGVPIYNERYIWVGNFQENLCTIQNESGFFHINNKGKRVYSEYYAYVGDFRDGVAVATSLIDGQSFHIQTDGKKLYTKSFRSLDVFHKGYARAKDENGWHHINREGLSCYPQRYANVEPFYNGLSVVEDNQGRRLRISQNGELIDILAEEYITENEHFQSLSADIVGYWKSLTISCAIKLGLVEALPGTTDEIAKTVGIRKEMALRILRATTELNLTNKNENEIWNLTSKGKQLKLSHPTSLAFSVLEMCGPILDKWKNLEDVLKDKKKPDDVFAEAAYSAERYKNLQDMMNSYANRDYQEAAKHLFLPTHGIVVDAGGGLGSLAKQIKSFQPKLEVKVFDRPEVCKLARERFFDTNLEWIGGDFFESWPIKADVIVMSRVLHDWDDNKCSTILKNARTALKANGKIVLVETILSENSGAYGLCDLHLLTVNGGKERTLNEFIQLGNKCGLSLSGVNKFSILHHTLEFKKNDQEFTQRHT
jgi:ubiquinone/menaquinone biosynthesis C-methylase UbiE